MLDCLNVGVFECARSCVRVRVLLVFVAMRVGRCLPVDFFVNLPISGAGLFIKFFQVSAEKSSADSKVTSGAKSSSSTLKSVKWVHRHDAWSGVELGSSLHPSV